jgi:protein phosphatase
MTTGLSGQNSQTVYLLSSEASNLRTKDSTSMIFVDLNVLRTDPCISNDKSILRQLVPRII